ncbi:MAG: prepilin-type N-terminal cleavage/methylation domain-containing protein [Armatimonadetes bacterium]|nr:prepilin-type N-terminal cleavage/methylation domain-containing protein [Armatimonadota bacterium]
MKNKAFTLIELLVVIAIIAILAAILFPVFAQAKQAAKKTQALAQMKQVGTSVLIYMTDYDDMTPPKVRFGFGPAQGGGDPYFAMTWDDIVQPYTKNWTIMTSGADTRAKADVPGVGQYRRGFAPAGNYFRGVQHSSNNGWAPLSGTSAPEVSRTVMFGEKRQPNYIGTNGVTAANFRSRDEWFWGVSINNTRRDNMPANDPRAQYGEIANSYGDGSVWIFADSSAKFLKTNGYASDGMLHGTVLPGYYPSPGNWVPSNTYWDNGVVCMDWAWFTGPGVINRCTIPGE